MDHVSVKLLVVLCCHQCDVTSCLLQGIMLVYDITNEKSFDNIRNWIRNIEEVSSAPRMTSVISC